MSWPPTLWDAIDSGEVTAESVWTWPQNVRPSMSVRAPCCGRKTSADAVWDVRAVPGTVIRAGGHGPPTDHDWLCGAACVQRMVRDPSTPWRKSDLAEAVGAPAAHVRVIRAKEAVRAEKRRRIREYRRAQEPSTVPKVDVVRLYEQMWEELAP